MMDQKRRAYYINIAYAVSRGATCDRAHVGCVLVRDNRIVATGFNGSPPGLVHCDQVGHDMQDGHCISGETRIQSWQHRTVSWWERKFQNPRSRSALLNRSRIRAMDLDDGSIVPAKVTDVWRTGEKELSRVCTTLGRTVSTTLDHRFFTPQGWKSLAELEIGSKVALNGVRLHDSEIWLRSKYVDEGLEPFEISDLAGVSRQTITRRLDKFNIPCRPPKPWAGWNKGLRYADNPLSEVLREAIICRLCKSTKNVQVHHIDRNRDNNNRTNLDILCVRCHNLAHTHSAKRKAIVFDSIVSITEIGVGPVYDLSVETYHNFVGDGFILHNCIRTIHGEANAINQCAFHGVTSKDAICFCTHQPCLDCTRKLYSAGIREIYFLKPYESMSTEDKTRVKEMIHHKTRGLIINQIGDTGAWMKSTHMYPGIDTLEY